MGSRSVDSLLNGFVEQMRKNSPQWSDSNKAGGSSTSAAVDRTILEDQISISLMTSPVAELLDDRVKGMILDPQSWPEYNAPGTTGDTLRYSWAGLADPHFRFRRTRRLPDNGREEPIHQFADNVFYCLLDLFVFTALQLWHDAERIIPKENFETNFNSALELLMSLQLLSKHEYIHKMNEITPNFTIIGLNKGIDDTIPKDNTGRSPLATLKMKSVDIIEKVYEEKLLVSSQFTGNNKDDFMTKLAAQGRTLKDTEGPCTGSVILSTLVLHSCTFSNQSYRCMSRRPRPHRRWDCAHVFMGFCGRVR
ncbi:hypothetical protein B0H34DRAFT_291488 [Crassisporium funariophilum]|nr:hypothetical protein B0H34DRAFT_291488 [Crassisporium funariophilum]